VLAALAYSFVSAVAFWQTGHTGAFSPYTQLVAAVGCWIAASIAVRRRPRAGVLVTLAVVWLEVHAGFAVAPSFPTPGLLVAPVLVMASGLLLGQRTAFLVAIASIVAATPAYLLGLDRTQLAFTRGDIYWLTVYATVIMAAWGVIAISLATLQRMVLAVRRKEGELSDLIEFAPDGIIVVGSDDRVRSVNPAAERLLGLPAHACIGRDITATLAAGGGVASVPTDTSGAPAADATRAYTFTRAMQPAIYVDIAWRTFGHDRRQLMLRDVSERVRSEQARRDAEAQLAHTQRLEAIGMLAGGVAHDFNNVLTTIGGSAHLLRDEPDDEQRLTLLDDIEAAQDRGATLTRQLLAFARREAVSPEVLDLGALVTDSQRLMQRLAGERMPISCDVAPDVRVRADLSQLEQALANLISNARDAMPEGGTCTITVRVHTDADGTRWARLRVSDTGIGMDPRTAARAFEPFFTTKPRGLGTGLGLASVHGIVLQHGGRAHIESSPGAGTSVVLEFPCTDAPIDAPHNRITTLPIEERGIGNVLVADDDDGTRAVVGRILQRAGYRVHLVPDGMQALRQLQSDPSAYDLLVTDVVMPGLTGPQLATRARAQQPTLPILFMSGYPEDALNDVERLGDSTGFLSKPFSGSELTQRVAEQLRSTHGTRD
jgi:signal transduction histidine kinase/ActR/RegA family two-component response regulator